MRTFSVIFVMAAFAAAPTIAQQSPSADLAPALIGTQVPLSASSEAPAALTSDLLAAESAQGVSNTVLTEQQLTATNSGNAVVATGNIVTGDIAFSSTALSGFSGVGNFVVNTGNNSNLQGSINVTIVTNGPLQ